jgi:ketosteroid isomerase-like protein
VLIRTTGDREMFIAHCNWVAQRGSRVSSTLLATSGDSLALMRLCWTAGRDAPPIEIEQLTIWEADTAGRLVAIIVFDPDDRRAAGLEMFERYARSDAAGILPAVAVVARRAFNDHDLDRFRATLHGDFVFHDHRRTGVGTLERTDDYIASIRPLFEGAADYGTENLYYIATDEHGSLAIARDFGTLADGGDFESVFIRLVRYRDDRIVAMEQFEPEDLDAARARFKALQLRR